MDVITAKLEKDRADLLEIIDAYRERIETGAEDVRPLCLYMTAHIMRLAEINDELQERHRRMSQAQPLASEMATA